MSKVSITIAIPENDTFSFNIVEKEEFDKWVNNMIANQGHEFDQKGYEDLTAGEILRNYTVVKELDHECEECHIGDELPKVDFD